MRLLPMVMGSHPARSRLLNPRRHFFERTRPENDEYNVTVMNISEGRFLRENICVCVILLAPYYSRPSLRLLLLGCQFLV